MQVTNQYLPKVFGNPAEPLGMTYFHDSLISGGLLKAQPKIQLRTPPATDSTQPQQKGQVFEVTVVEQRRISQQNSQPGKTTASHLLKVSDGKHTISIQSERSLPVGTQLTLRLTPGASPNSSPGTGPDQKSGTASVAKQSTKPVITLEILNVKPNSIRAGKSTNSSASAELGVQPPTDSSGRKMSEGSRPNTTRETPNHIRAWMAGKLVESDWAHQRNPADTYQQAFRPQHQVQLNTPNNASNSAQITLLSQLARLTTATSTDKANNLSALSSLIIREGQLSGHTVQNAMESSGLFLENKLVKAVFGHLTNRASGAPTSPFLAASSSSVSTALSQSLPATNTDPTGALERTGSTAGKEATSPKITAGLHIKPEAINRVSAAQTRSETGPSQSRDSGIPSLYPLLSQQQRKINAQASNLQSLTHHPYRLTQSASAPLSTSLSMQMSGIIKSDVKGVLMEALGQLSRTPATRTASEATAAFGSQFGVRVGQRPPNRSFETGLSFTDFWRKKEYKLQPLSPNQPAKTASSMPEDIRQLLNKALSELELEQIRQHPNGPFAKENATDLQIPVFYQYQNQIRQVLVEISEKQPAEQSDHQTKNSWDIRLHFDLDEQGLLDVSLSLKWPEVSAIFWVEQSQTLKAVRQDLPNIRERIQNLGGDIGDLEARKGSLKSLPKTLNRQSLLDIRI